MDLHCSVLVPKSRWNNLNDGGLRRKIFAYIFTSLGCCFLFLDATKGALAATDTTTIVVSNLPANTCCETGAVSTFSPSATSGGNTYVTLMDKYGSVKEGGDFQQSTFSVSGFSADPGKAWLTSISHVGTTLSGATASSYTYNAGVATWNWTSGPIGLIDGSSTLTVVHGGGDSGYLRPKYQVVSVTYAPPGAKSTVQYSNGFLSGTSTSNTATYLSSVNDKVTLSTGFNLFGILGGKATQSFSVGWSQQQDNSNSLSVVQQLTNGETVLGPLSSAAGVDHDYDTIYVWLNPEVFLTVFSPVSVTLNGYGYDARDTITGMDVIPLTVGQLKGVQAITDPLVQERLARSWDGELGGLTSTDFQQILQADPFVANPSFNPNTDTSHRFELPELADGTPLDLIFNYVPAPPGGQPTTQSFSSNYSGTSVSGQAAKDTYSVGYSLDGDVQGSFFLSLKTTMAFTTTYSYTNQWSNTVTAGTSQSASFTIVPPLSTDGYTGPTALQVWKDNVYGTFMFFPEN
jgi:hypothetical protein